MRKTTLAVTVSSVLLAAVAVQAEPGADPSQNQQAQATSQTDTSRPSPTSPAPDADTGTSSTGSSDQGNVDVGSAKSNVDKDSSSGSYYPYSAGTAGDDPAKPTSTSVSPDANDTSSEPTDQWMDPAADADGDGYLSRDELTKVAPTLVANFSEMDVDGDQKLTRAEYRTWNESQKARMEADQGANASTSSSQGSDATSTGSTSTSGDTSSPSEPSSIDSGSGTTPTTPATDDSTSSSSTPPKSNTGD